MLAECIRCIEQAHQAESQRGAIGKIRPETYPTDHKINIPRQDATPEKVEVQPSYPPTRRFAIKHLSRGATRLHTIGYYLCSEINGPIRIGKHITIGKIDMMASSIKHIKKRRPRQKLDIINPDVRQPTVHVPPIETSQVGKSYHLGPEGR